MHKTHVKSISRNIQSTDRKATEDEQRTSKKNSSTPAKKGGIQ